MEKTAIKFLWKYAKQFKWFFLFMILGFIVSHAGEQLATYFSARLIAFAAGETAAPDYWHSLIFYAFIVFGAGLIRLLGFEASFFLMAHFLPAAKTIIVSDIFQHVNKLSTAYFNDEMSGRVATKFAQLEKSVIEAFRTFGNVCDNFLWAVITIGILSFIDIRFLAALTIWLFLIGYAAKCLGKKRLELSRETGKEESLANGVVVDSLANYSEVKSFANFRFEQLNLLKYLKLLRKADSREQKMKAWIHLTQNLLTTFSMLGFMLLSLAIFKSGAISTTEFIYAISLFTHLSFMVFGMTWIYSNISQLLGSMQSALDTLSAEPEIVDKPGALKLKADKAEIMFEDVDFHYRGKRKIFNKLNLKIKAGEKVGIVGPSGAGKSTLIKLTDRCFDINKGAIKINGIDIRDITQESLHRHIAIIPQDISLFNRSLKENIRYGKTSATTEEIINAARQASADIFIEAMPRKYDTVVGERGVVLSGGERQRIAIARAILKNAPILIFDEATSALDSYSEQHIQKSLKLLMKNKTVIAIAHRLSTLREMDRILVFDKGKIIEEGTHETLLKKKGMYYKLYNMQANGFMGITPAGARKK